MLSSVCAELRKHRWCSQLVYTRLHDVWIFFKKGHFVRQLMGIRLKNLLSAEFRIIFSTRKIILHLFFFFMRLHLFESQDINNAVGLLLELCSFAVWAHKTCYRSHNSLYVELLKTNLDNQNLWDNIKKNPLDTSSARRNSVTSLYSWISLPCKSRGTVKPQNKFLPHIYVQN